MFSLADCHHAHAVLRMWAWAGVTRSKKKKKKEGSGDSPELYSELKSDLLISEHRTVLVQH